MVVQDDPALFQGQRNLLALKFSIGATMTRIILIGNLGRDPELGHTPNGQPITSFSVRPKAGRPGS